LKWRPQTFEGVIGQQHITRTLRNALRQERIRHAYLFSGPRGTGKTSTARLLAKAVNCADPDPDNRPCNVCHFCQSVNEGRFMDLIEIDAASHTGVDDVRDLRDKIAFAPSEGRYKVYIIDEVHRFSGAAFDALLKTLEEPPPHAIFVLATTEIAKVPATIKSRCQQFEFRRVSLAEVTSLLQEICDEEGVSIDRAALELIAREGTGSVRDSISLLDQLLADPDAHISLEEAEAILGTASGYNVVELADALIANDAARGLDLINAAVDGGADPRQFCRQAVEHLRQMMLVKMGGDDLVDVSAERLEIVRRQAEAIGRKALLNAIRAFNSAIQEWQGGWQPQLPLELAFLESIKPVEEDEPVPAPRPAYVRTQDDLPKPIPPAPPAPNVEDSTVKLPEINARWKEVVSRVHRIRSLLAPLVHQAKPRDLKNGRLVLGIENAIHQEKLQADDNRQIIETVLAEMFGVSFTVVVTVSSPSGERDQAQDELLAQDDVLAFGVNELGGELSPLDGE
jgi:DNA polymerase-3 subunit gamma/tau